MDKIFASNRNGHVNTASRMTKINETNSGVIAIKYNTFFIRFSLSPLRVHKNIFIYVNTFDVMDKE